MTFLLQNTKINSYLGKKLVNFELGLGFRMVRLIKSENFVDFNYRASSTFLKI